MSAKPLRPRRVDKAVSRPCDAGALERFEAERIARMRAVKCYVCKLPAHLLKIVEKGLAAGKPYALLSEFAASEGHPVGAGSIRVHLLRKHGQANG